MKNAFRVFIALLLLVTTIPAISQLPVKVPATGNTTASAGKLLEQFTNGLNPTALTGNWAGSKTGFLSGLGKINNAAGFGKNIGTLAGFIKPDMFRQGFNVQSLIQTANTVKTMSSAAGLLKNLEGGLKPTAFTGSWNQNRPAWLQALSLIK
ncbi:MAG TPA: hypothetical protein PKE07_12625 [Lacibacter sp.]|nr:hypothetical protein [Lacibacter sp.]HMO90236.1 hypothetical protein [Lacibacter sp.]